MLLCYLCCLEQQLIIYSTFLNLFFSLFINGPSREKTLWQVSMIL